MAMRATYDYLNRLFDGGGHYMTGDKYCSYIVAVSFGGGNRVPGASH
jgi:hypothetical protein